MLSKQRYVVVAFLVTGLLTSMTLARGFEWLSIYLGFEDPAIFGIRQLPLTALFSYGISAAGIVFCLKNEAIAHWASEVVEELSKVVWPTREETGQATVVVVVTVIICSVFLGLFDAIWLWLTDRLLGIG
jgi:preprotein translocase subunit SecE